MNVPPTPGGLVPKLAVSYSSGAVDGRTASTNAQPSWIGEGQSLETGYIERQFVSCNDDGPNATAQAGQQVGDLCWKKDNAQLVLGGHSTTLFADTNGAWHLKNDDGSLIKKTGLAATSTTASTEQWILTATDGTQYVFGQRKRPGDSKPTSSVWSVPVAGNQSGEPCHQSTFAASFCAQPWRWNLDYVIDPHQNTMTYFYVSERNYFTHADGGKIASYDRGGYLSRIEYGGRKGTEYKTHAPAQVNFAVAERCLAPNPCGTGPIAAADASKWPDVPVDQICSEPSPGVAPKSCKNTYGPVFFSRKRLVSVTTQVWSGTAAVNVDQWAFKQSFPPTGDSSDPGALWLDSITRTGLVGGSKPLPPITFTSAIGQFPNRVDAVGDGAPAMYKARLSFLTTESGGQVTLTYSAQDCKPGDVPTNAAANTRRCFPVFYTKPGATKPTLNYFHKYVVTGIAEHDATGRSPLDKVTTYDYSSAGDPGSGKPAWHYDENDVTPTKYRTYNEWRGYATVKVKTGNSDLTRSLVKSVYLRGMDHAGPNGTGSAVSTTSSQGDTVVDVNRAAGFLLEQTTYNGVTKDDHGNDVVGPEVTGTVTLPWLGKTASADSMSSWLLGSGTVKTRTDLASGGVRTTQINTSFDPKYGLPLTVEDLGDTSTADDDQCVRNTYVQNTSLRILTRLSRVQRASVKCSTTPTVPGQIISDVENYYDQHASLADPPTQGDLTRVDTLTDSTSTPPGDPTFVTTAKWSFDAFGRNTQTYDGLDHLTSTAYVASPGGLVASIKTTNPLNQVKTQALDPTRGLPIEEKDAGGKLTDFAYDPLGRRTAVWTPGLPKSGPAMVKFNYSDDLLSVTTEKLRKDNQTDSYVKSTALVDGFLRPVQTQLPSADGVGRVLNDTAYDERGQARDSDTYYDKSSGPSTTLFTPTDPVESRTRTTYDGVGRPTIQTLIVRDAEKWHTTTTYGGDRVTVDPPAGGTPTTTVTDARGHTTLLRQYKDADRLGGFLDTQYTYTPGGQLHTITDSSKTVWTYGYDLRGRKISTDDPDKGHSESTYNNNDEEVTTTTSQGELSYDYDALGRRTARHQGPLSGPIVARWTFDVLPDGTPAPGKLIGSSRIVAGRSYTTAITGFDAANNPTGTRLSIPSIPGEEKLAGTYDTKQTFNPDGSLASSTEPVNTASTAPSSDLGSEELDYFYNPIGLPDYFAGNGGYVAHTVYSPYGEATQTVLGSISGKFVNVDAFFEDGTRRLTRQIVERENISGPYAADTTYAYDAVGNLTMASDAPTGQAPDTQCFQYDYLRRLTEAWTASGTTCPSTPSIIGTGPAPYWQSYGYYDNGNRRTDTKHTSSGDASRTYTYPDPTAAHPHFLSQVTGGGKTDTYSPDDSGNTRTRNAAGTPGQTLSWDVEGRLDTIASSTGTTSYLYDADGNRLLRRDPQAVTLYVGGNEFTLNKTTAALTETRYYSHNGNVVAIRTSAGVKLMASDPHGTTTVAVDYVGQAYVKRRTSPFGDVRDSTPAPWPGQRGFVGGNQDVSAGLVHLGAREYDPTTGRFLSADPVLDATNPQQLNGYAYANNNPETFSDPTGLDILGAVVQVVSVVEKVVAAWVANSNRHNKAVNEAVLDIEIQVAERGGDPSKVAVNTLIKGGSKKGTGFNGFADITYDDGKNVYVWEVKGSISPAGAIAQGETAVLEVQHYVKFYQAALGTSRQVKPGFALTGPRETTFDGPYGPELMTVSNGPGPGAIVYLSQQIIRPVPLPGPRPVPYTAPAPRPVPVMPGIPDRFPHPVAPGTGINGGDGSTADWPSPPPGSPSAGRTILTAAGLLLLGILGALDPQNA